MQRSQEEESGEEARVARTYAGANPGTVMIVYLNAHSTSRAVERARRAQYFAGRTIAQFVVGVVLIHYHLSIGIFLKYLVLEFLFLVVLGGIIVLAVAKILHGLVQLLLRLIKGVVAQFLIWLVFSLIRQHIVDREARYDAWLGACTIEQGEQADCQTNQVEQGEEKLELYRKLLVH